MSLLPYGFILSKPPPLEKNGGSHQKISRITERQAEPVTEKRRGAWGVLHFFASLVKLNAVE